MDVNQADERSSTPLNIASEKGHTDVVKLLLTKDGVDINKAWEKGGTPLYFACQNGHTAVVELLLTHGGVNVNQAFLLETPNIKVFSVWWLKSVCFFFL